MFFHKEFQPFGPLIGLVDNAIKKTMRNRLSFFISAYLAMSK
jgi:hypothetical protein